MIHQYKLGGYNIVLDICSGAVHVVDDVAYDVIEKFQTQDKATIISCLTEKYKDNPDVSPEDINECYEQVSYLEKNELLFV